MLSNAAVKAARPKPRAYKMFDERGLFLFVKPSGLRSWRLRYKIDGREKLLCLGQWPDLQLVDARDRAEEARGLVAQGVDPSGTKAVQICSFESVARAWHAQSQDHWTERHAQDVIDSLRRDVFPEIGALPVGTITAPAVRDVLRDVEARGSIETARRIRQRISMVFCFAIAEGWAKEDPAAVVGRALRPKPMAQRQPALIEIEQLRDLLAACDRAGGPPIVRLASRFLALTAVRMGALLGARWEEFEDLDGAAPLWRIPAARMKISREKKDDAANDHLVPLSPQAVAVLHSFATIVPPPAKAGVFIDAAILKQQLVFPIAGSAIGRLYKRAGFAGRHVPHGWRASFSTILNERFPLEHAAIDLALAHVPAKMSKVERAYNRAEMLDQRRDLYARWGALLGG